MSLHRFHATWLDRVGQYRELRIRPLLDHRLDDDAVVPCCVGCTVEARLTMIADVGGGLAALITAFRHVLLPLQHPHRGLKADKQFMGAALFVWVQELPRGAIR